MSLEDLQQLGIQALRLEIGTAQVAGAPDQAPDFVTLDLYVCKDGVQHTHSRCMRLDSGDRRALIQNLLYAVTSWRSSQP